MNIKSILWTLALALSACAIQPSTGQAERLRNRSGAYSVEVLVDGRPMHNYWHKGESYVMGRRNRRYTLRVHNRSNQRVEALVTVDGLDVLDGKRGSYKKRGYLISAWGHTDIEGWRLSNEQVAAFRFSSVANSYAGKTGRTRNVGVVGVAIFPERIHRVYRSEPEPMPYSPQIQDDFEEMEQSAAPRASASSGYGRGGGSASADSSAKSPLGGIGSRRARSSAPRAKSMKKERKGLATRFGERRYSHVSNVHFERANYSHPFRILGFRYNNRSGLLAMGVKIPPHQPRESILRKSATPFSSNGYATPPRDWY